MVVLHRSTEYTLVKRKRRKKSETTSEEIKICHGQLTWYENSQTQILELKRITTFFCLFVWFIGELDHPEKCSDMENSTQNPKF